MLMATLQAAPLIWTAMETVGEFVLPGAIWGVGAAVVLLSAVGAGLTVVITVGLAVGAVDSDGVG
jgi:hypothetical protein